MTFFQSSSVKSRCSFAQRNRAFLFFSLSNGFFRSTLPLRPTFFNLSFTVVMDNRFFVKLGHLFRANALAVSFRFFKELNLILRSSRGDVFFGLPLRGKSFKV